MIFLIPFHCNKKYAKQIVLVYYFSINDNRNIAMPPIDFFRPLDTPDPKMSSMLTLIEALDDKQFDAFYSLMKDLVSK